MIQTQHFINALGLRENTISEDRITQRVALQCQNPDLCGKGGFAVHWTGQGEGYLVALGLCTHLGPSWQMVSLLLDPRWADTGRPARGLGGQGNLPRAPASHIWRDRSCGAGPECGRPLPGFPVCRRAGVYRQISRDRSTYIIIGNPELQPGVESWAVSVLGVPWTAEASWQAQGAPTPWADCGKVGCLPHPAPLSPGQPHSGDLEQSPQVT